MWLTIGKPCSCMQFAIFQYKSHENPYQYWVLHAWKIGFHFPRHATQCCRSLMFIGGSYVVSSVTLLGASPYHPD